MSALGHKHSNQTIKPHNKHHHNTVFHCCLLSTQLTALPAATLTINMQLLNKQPAGVSYFERQQVVKGQPLPVAQRMAVCPTVKSFHPLWGKIEHVEAPGPNELVHFRAGQEAQHATTTEQLSLIGNQARSIIDQHILETGSLLLQGLSIASPGACEAFVNGMGFTRQKYEPYGGTRQKILSLDAATNVGPAELLDLHNEMCYNPRPNKKIILICLKPAAQGGESLIGDSTAIAAAMPEFVLQRFADRGGVLYTRKYISAAKAASADSGIAPPGLSWQERTGFSDPEAAAGFFTDLGFRVEWQAADTLVATHVAPPVVPHPVTGQPVWFNLTHLAGPGWTEYADGAPIEPDAIEAISAARLSATRALMLRAGDVLVMDNYRAAHGRLPYDGSDRTLVAVLTSD